MIRCEEINCLRRILNRSHEVTESELRSDSGGNMDEKTIARINELARKSKGVGLTTGEKDEQARLRKEYIATIRMNLRSQLDNIDVQEEDGSIVNLGEKYGDKAKH